MTESAFRFGSYTFPIPPSRFEVSDRLEIRSYAAPLIGQVQQSMGRVARIVTGEGSFFGSTALSDYRTLQTIFLAGNAALLTLPGCAPFEAHFSELAMAGRAGPMLVRYIFTFTEKLEGTPGDAQRYHIAAGTETIWDLAAKYRLSPDTLMRLNPAIDWGVLAPGTRILCEEGSSDQS